MDLAQAISVLKELQKIPSLPSPKLADTGVSGVFLIFRKALVGKSALNLLTIFAEDNKLGVTESENNYVIGAQQPK